MMKRASLGVCLLFLLSTWVGVSQNRTLVIRIALSEDDQIQVEPDRLEINLGDRVRWETTGARRDEVEIEFAFDQGTRGPFRSRDSSDNPSRGRFRKRAGRDVTSGPSDMRGEFKYSIFWLAANGEMMHLDPVIVVR